MDGVDFSKYTHINLAFSIPKADGTFSFEDDWAMPQIMKQLRAANVKVLMSVGGWTGSNHFSNILKSQSAKDTMIKGMVDYVKANELDGIDIDWEYPGRLGNDCNAFDATHDAGNYLMFLKELRAKFDSTFGQRAKLITLAVRVQPFDGPSGPISNVTDYAHHIDFANLMQYDINGGWNSVTGPNAPFNFEEGKGMQASFVSAIDAWLRAGWPANQLTAGLGFYGRSTVALQDMTKENRNQYQPQSKEVPLGDQEDASWSDRCARTTSNSGTWQWKNLRRQGVLTSNGIPSHPWIRQWDNTTQTPWLFNAETKVFLSYDDPRSIKIKADHAASKGLAGIMVWSVNMDYKNELLSAASVFKRDDGAGKQIASSPSNGGSKASSSSASIVSSSSSIKISSISSTSSVSARSSTTNEPIKSASTSGSAATSPAMNINKSSMTSASASSNKVTSSPSAMDSEPQTQLKTTMAPGLSSSPSPSASTSNHADLDSEFRSGGACREDGAYKCIDRHGNSPDFLTCDRGKWIQESCASPLICIEVKDAVACAWSRTGPFVRVLKGVIH
ncbi:hypothetical protein GGI12_005013 [Dipsacomyces acuminosporus]|nr:hypothetical protein GGI12_005013 [Dipsacomyces acuminosporus]